MESNVFVISRSMVEDPGCTRGAEEDGGGGGNLNIGTPGTTPSAS